MSNQTTTDDHVLIAQAQIEADLEGLAYRMEHWVDAMADCSFADCAPHPD